MATLWARCNGLMVPTIALLTPGWAKSSSKLARTGSTPGARQAWPLARAFLTRMALAVLRSVVEYRALCLFVQVEGDHGAVALLQGLQASGYSLA